MSAVLNVAILCGGVSPEHQVSLISASHVFNAVDRTRYSPAFIYISREGQWFSVPAEQQDDFLAYCKTLPRSDERLLELRALQAQWQPLVLCPGRPEHPWQPIDASSLKKMDCVIPMLHGNGGEDGTIQGLLNCLGVPYVGTEVLGSAICMEKHITKRLLRFANLPTVDWLMVTEPDFQHLTYEHLVNRFGEVLFIKPASLGSSIGISRVDHREAWEDAMRQALQYDDQVLIEPCVQGREIECAVLGDGQPRASLPGEIIPEHGKYAFYSFDAKYCDPNGATLCAPAELSPMIQEQIQLLAIEAFKVLHCRGMARVDFFVRGREILINEVNTIPGFTSISMYPKLWQVSGLSYAGLLTELIELALSRQTQRSQLTQLKLPLQLSR